MSKWCGDENCLQCVDKEPDPYVHLPREDYQAFRDECERLRKLIRTYLTAKDEALKTSEDQDCEEWREKYRAYWDAHEALDATLVAQDAGKGDKEGEQMEHEELVRRIAKSGQEIKDSLSAKDLDLWHHATGCATEAGELLDAAKKVAIYNKPVDRENVIEELGDLEFYMQGLRANLGITREECLAHNIAKLTKRYPKGTFDNADAVARADKHGEKDH